MSDLNYTHTIKEIIDRFDFNKAHKIMSFLEWKWAFSSNSEFRVPKVEEIVNHCQRLLQTVSHSKGDNYLESGGFIAVRSGDGSLELRFTPVHCDSFYYDDVAGYHLSFENGHKIIVQHFFKKVDIEVGSRWISTGKVIVTVTQVDFERNELTYVDYLGNERKKDIFCFQSRYCLILEDS